MTAAPAPIIRVEHLFKRFGALEVLRQPFHVDRRGGVLPGQEPTARVPIFSGAGPELVVRYLRYWIESGSKAAGKNIGRKTLGTRTTPTHRAVAVDGVVFDLVFIPAGMAESSRGLERSANPRSMN